MADKSWLTGTVFATILGSFISCATGIQGYLQKQRELELQTKQQEQQLRLAYMDLLVEGGLDRLALVAEFASQTEEHPRIRRSMTLLSEKARDAATKEKERLEELERQLADAEQARAEAEEKVERAQEQLAGLRQKDAAGEATKKALKTEEQALREAALARARVDVTKEKAARTKQLLSGKADVSSVKRTSTEGVEPAVLLPSDTLKRYRDLLTHQRVKQ